MDNTASYNDYGILLGYASNNNNLTGNTASYSTNGMYLADSDYNNLTSNAAFNNSVGIYLTSSSNNILSGDHAYNNGHGLYLGSSSNNTVTGNDAYNNEWNGICLVEDSNNNEIEGNNGYRNWYGIFLSTSSSNNTVNANLVYNNREGIYFRYDSGDNNTITDNKIYNNSEKGISLYSSNNLIYNNYFDNTQNAYDDGNNTWNISKTLGTSIIGSSYLGGNYWSDYTGKDLGDDGLGDTNLPYNASGEIVNGGDWLPLVKPEETIFDTDEGSYPSISGTFNGTITPSRNLTVSTLYTYSCTGIGGHTKSIALYKNSTLVASGVWDGYTGDWHNLTFNNSFTLYVHETYNYTIRTGSYPQIIHEQSWNATGGVITCSEFVDINGKLHEGWIPAIRLS